MNKNVGRLEEVLDSSESILSLISMMEFDVSDKDRVNVIVRKFLANPHLKDLLNQVDKVIVDDKSLNADSSNGTISKVKVISVGEPYIYRRPIDDNTITSPSITWWSNTQQFDPDLITKKNIQ